MSMLVVYGKTVVAAPGKVFSNAFIEIHNGRIYRITYFGKEPDIEADIVMPGFIDPHAHCRDWKQSRKETLKSAGEAAVHGGITQVHDMPNTVPPIMGEDDVKRRLEAAERSRIPVRYMLYVGLSSGRSQVREAADCVLKYPQVAGLKLYAGESVGGLAVADPVKQLEVYRALASSKYHGVLLVHCEKVSEFSDGIWSVNNPQTWCDIRPPKAEIESVRDQLGFAVKAGFKGRLHFCHVTVPESVELIRAAPKTLRVSCGVTPHHLLLSSEIMKRKSRGLYYKVNPPLRTEQAVLGLVRKLLTGSIDWIETDHAPHTINEKLSAPFASGLPELDTFSNFIAALGRHYGVPWDDVLKLTSLNAVKAFGLPSREIKPGNAANMTLIDMNPETIEREDLKTNCGWSPYEGMTFPGRCRAVIIDGEPLVLKDGVSIRSRRQ
ncbi:MAG: dihydroorotase family protein [Candidatus Aenigmarchaeota archaeon]|nr:dihydroorotase family protein [Candidatus Aenigmarchaeota archaeon]